MAVVCDGQYDAAGRCCNLAFRRHDGQADWQSAKHDDIPVGYQAVEPLTNLPQVDPTTGNPALAPGIEGILAVVQERCGANQQALQIEAIRNFMRWHPGQG